MKADFHSLQMPTQNFGVSWSTKPPLRSALHCGRQRVFKQRKDVSKRDVIDIFTWERYTVEALVSDHLGNLEKWSQLDLVAYENGLS